MTNLNEQLLVVGGVGLAKVGGQTVAREDGRLQRQEGGVLLTITHQEVHGACCREHKSIIKPQKTNKQREELHTQVSQLNKPLEITSGIKQEGPVHSRAGAKTNTY